MAFGGLQGLTPGEFLRRFGMNAASIPMGAGEGAGALGMPYAPIADIPQVSGIPFGAVNFDASQLSPNLRGPALPGLSALNPTQAQLGLLPEGPAIAGGWQAPMSPWSRNLPQSAGMPMPGGPLPTRTPGQFTESFAPSGAQITAAQGRQAQALAGSVVNPAGSVPMGAGQVGNLPFARNLQEVPPSFWLEQARGPGGRMLPRVPPQIVTGPAYDVATRMPVGPPGAFAAPGRFPGAPVNPSPMGVSLPGQPLALPAGPQVGGLPRPVSPAMTFGTSEVPVSIRGTGGASAASTLASEVAPAAAGATTTAAGLRGAIGAARAGGLRGALGTLGEGSALAGGGLRGAAGTLARRAIPGLLAYQGLHALSGALGGDSSIAGQAAEGAAVAGGIGTTAGGPLAGLVAGGVGAVANPIVDRLTGGRSFTESLSNLLSGGQDPTEQAIRDQFAGVQGGEQQADAIITRMDNINQGREARWEGVPEDIKDQLVSEYNTAAANIDGSTEEGQAQLRDLLFRTAQAAELAKSGELTMPAAQDTGPRPLTTADLAATQALASQFMAPVAADSAAIGQMGQAALQNLAGPMRGPVGDSLRDLANIYGQGGNNMANAYMQQAYVDPQIAVLNQQLSLRDQIAQQLTAQAIAQLPQFATGGGSSFDDIIAASAMGGGSTNDTASALAASIAGG